MANWEKINKRLDEVLDNLTHEDWLIWQQKKEANTAMRRKFLALQGQIQGLIFKIDAFEIEKQIVKHQSFWCKAYKDLQPYGPNMACENNPPNLLRGYFFNLTSCNGRHQTSRFCSRRLQSNQLLSLDSTRYVRARA